MTLLQLCDYLGKRGHKLYEYNLGGEQAATINLDGKYAIFIDPEQISTIAEKTCTIAHELGHCETGTTHHLYGYLDLVGRYEWKANKWAAHHLIPPEKIKKAMRSGYTEAWQLAEYFDVTEEFIRTAIYIYQCEELIS